jgi:hypothetical protein
MNPPSMETIFLLLSGVILIAGVLYWFWSHLQLTQKKVQLLENAVFELRGMLASRTDSGPPVVIGGGGGAVYKDLGDDDGADDWQEEAEGAEIAEERVVAVPTLRVEKVVDTVDEGEEASAEATLTLEEAEALKPGGRIEVPVVEEPEISSSEQFRTLFTAEEGASAPPASPAAGSQSLEGMPVRELRQLAEKRGIKGAEAMKKKELLGALRAQAGSQTLDLTAMGVVKEDAEVEAALVEEADTVPVLE